MLIATLFQTMTRGVKPPKLAADQYEFNIDRKNRRILGAWQGILQDHETIRIQANRPYTWTGDTELPDTSLGVLRPLRCQVHIEGLLPSSEPMLRALLTLLLQDGYDFDTLFTRHLDKAIAQQRLRLEGRFFDALSASADVIGVKMAAAMTADGVPVQMLILRRKQYDLRPALDLADETDGVTVRARDQLQSHRVTYKARLVWGNERDQKIATLAYDDKFITGKTGASMTNPLVEGQTQPLEAYFRKLLTEALTHETYAAVKDGSAATLGNLKNYISEKLGRGTGRVVDTLVVYPNSSDLADHNERSTRFSLDYDIIGIPGNKLRIAHSIMYVMTDRDRWKSQGSPDPEAFLQREMLAATGLFLQGKRFEDVVDLYLSDDVSGDGKSGDARLGKEVVERVLPIAATIGFRLESSSAILDIPQHEFVIGKEIDLGEREYPLADPHLAPSIRMKAMVRVKDGRMFARALARGSDFEGNVRGVLEQAARSALRGRSGLEYYSSSSVRRGVTRPGGDDSVIDAETRSLSDLLSEAIEPIITEQFGLILTHLYILPVQDNVFMRMQDLSKRSISYFKEFIFPRGRVPVTLRAQAEIFVVALDPEHWQSFYQNVPRFPTAHVQIEAFSDLLTQTLQMAEHALVGDGRAALQSRELHRSVIREFTGRIAQQYGLVVQLRPLSLSVTQRTEDDTFQLMLDATRSELTEVLKKRIALQETASTDADYEREKLTQRIALLRGEIKQLTEESEQNIAQSETVQVFQNGSNGIIEAEPPAPQLRQAAPPPAS